MATPVTLTDADGLPTGVTGAPLVVTPVSGGVDQDVNLAAVGGVATSLGQKAMTASIPVVLASNQASIPVASSSADGADVALGAVADAAATAGGTGTVSAKLRRISTQLPAAVGQTTMAASLPVVLASNQSPVNVLAPVETTNTPAAVALSASTAATLLAANASRIRATIYNPLATLLFVRKATLAGSPATVSAGGYDFAISSGGTFISDPGEYAGAYNGICATAGSVNVSESV